MLCVGDTTASQLDATMIVVVVVVVAVVVVAVIIVVVVVVGCKRRSPSRLVKTERFKLISNH